VWVSQEERVGVVDWEILYGVETAHQVVRHVFNEHEIVTLNKNKNNNNNNNNKQINKIANKIECENKWTVYKTKQIIYKSLIRHEDSKQKII